MRCWRRRYEATDSHGDTALVGFEIHLDKPLLLTGIFVVLGLVLLGYFRWQRH